MKKQSVFGRTHPAVVAVWAAVLAAAMVLPSIPLIGTGGTFSVATALFPISGIFFGPIAGFITAAIGGFIGSLLAPHTAWMGMGTFIVGAISALTAGLITEGKWKTTILALCIFAIGTILWFTQPIGQSAPFFPIVFYGLGAIACVIGSVLVMKGFLVDNGAKKAINIWFIGFASMAATASIANFVTLVLFQTPREVWMMLTVQAPTERAIFAVGTAIIAVPLLIGLPKIGVFVGPDADEEDEGE